jgi:hypothetical protein
MILTTEQQAHNFALYALENDFTLEGLNHECLLAGVMSTISLIMGSLTFSEERLEALAESAIKFHEEHIA